MSIVSSDEKCDVLSIPPLVKNSMTQIIRFSLILCDESFTESRVQFKRVQFTDFVIKKIKKIMMKMSESLINKHNSQSHFKTSRVVLAVLYVAELGLKSFDDLRMSVAD